MIHWTDGSMRRPAMIRFILTLVSLAIMVNYGFAPSTSLPKKRVLSSQETKEDEKKDVTKAGLVTKYNTQTIIESLPYIIDMMPILVTFNKWDFEVFSLYRTNLTYVPSLASSRLMQQIPFLIDSLKKNFPDRFKPGPNGKDFELIIHVWDYINSNCINPDVQCPSHKFPPIISFGSVPRDETQMPTVKAFPHSRFIHCLSSFFKGRVNCGYRVNGYLRWRNLVPTIFWRGSDFSNFIPEYHNVPRIMLMPKQLNEETCKGLSKEQIVDKIFDLWDYLTPRWRGAALSLKAKYIDKEEEPWIDTMFTPETKVHKFLGGVGLPVGTNKRVPPHEMSRYRYQIDYGGGGGTSWDGTIHKLLMPGVLFHHETNTKDFFYDEMKPYVHFIPVKQDLSDLREKYEWAVAHPEEAETIAKQATEFASGLFKSRYLRKLYDDLYINYLGQVVDAYDPGTTGRSFQEKISMYKAAGYRIHPVATMTDDPDLLAVLPGSQAKELRLKLLAEKKR